MATFYDEKEIVVHTIPNHPKTRKKLQKNTTELRIFRKKLLKIYPINFPNVNDE